MSAWPHPAFVRALKQRPHPGPLPVGEGAEAEDGIAFLSENELKILAGLRFEKRRREWLMGRWTAKKLLTVQLGCAPRELSIEPEAGGAPVVWRAGERVPGCLSISHRGDRATAAWADVLGMQVGVDLELVGEANPAWMVDYLTEAEWGLCEGQGIGWPYLVWSAKEAVLKSLRTGLRVDTREIEALPGEGELDGWRRLDVRSGLLKGDCWVGWRSDGGYLLTMAVLKN
ncbi:MAG: 4'-phosphopantetheinyl transferase superfamily protein [Anaerolineaceae bacterium]|nr:4'-phosphopantetheinyl transferase superfamily protein [Anaerolineaceae bacterium]